ncbi:MFS transporter [Photobacterium iliopiscarium]|jgi:intracellular septation protein A|uniref:MFS transporter n=1 Tax=Photobacterium iliopiscarium TaxID=56192 RepID=A0A0D8PZT5_9GAMM|nr:VC0807 family protein [Photobacterium iliopiscarium]KJG13545.1 MFS transporter [Photobacterium iliopiscarium]KJG22684.1 MFS transporter [Photobacterium iliopiscarium]MCD9467911.1 MFS transporter [Photobacterium iliopiscarium]MCD9487616.1 MFS transporter [Photobacterium iliopiscarium]MCF2244210.1 MFS transporter [Photobacterium iliopiscarium]
MAEKKTNPLNEIIFNVVVPSIILMKMSSDDRLGSVGALLVALAFPVAFGGYELLKKKKLNFIAILGIVSVLLTGGIGVLKLDTQWLAVKEALIPGIIGAVVLGSTFTKYPIVTKMIFNEGILNLGLIKQKLMEFNQQKAFDRCLVQSNYLFASTFVFSSIMNYILATVIVTSPAGTEAFNEELGRMTLLSYPVIAIPSMLMMMGIFYFVWRQIRKMTKLETVQIFKTQ